ncbi:MAG: hypothetical protein AAF718_05745 [Pseudomonadota bacterium]
MRQVFDGILSAFAALVALIVIGVPVWGAFLALRAELLPVWGWGPLVLLSAAGLVMVLSFLRKAGRGVHPLRERRR